MLQRCGLLLAVLLFLYIGPACEALSPAFGVMWSSFKTKKGTADDTPEISGSSSEEAIQASFPQEQRFWNGNVYALLGSGIRYYKLGFLQVKVYGLAMYVEKDVAVAELARLKKEGFFAEGGMGVDRMCAAIAAINCNKVAQIQLLRSITSSQFTGALTKSLQPRLADTDDKKYIPGFEKYFETKSLNTGTNVPLMWTDAGDLQADLLAPGQTNFQDVKPSLAVPSLRFCQALFDIYLSTETPVSGAREQWAASVKGLLNLTSSLA